jgi:hypothetical protein
MNILVILYLFFVYFGENSLKSLENFNIYGHILFFLNTGIKKVSKLKKIEKKGILEGRSLGQLSENSSFIEVHNT